MMLSTVAFALTILGNSPAVLPVHDTVGLEGPPVPTLAPTLHNLYPQRFDASYAPFPSAGDDQAQRAKAVQHSDFYYTRLKIHQWGAIVMIPLAIAQYFIGQDLYKNGNNAAQWEHDIHGPLAATIAVDYGVQLVTGVWNGVEDWGNPGQARRTVHSALMLLAGAGFVAVGATAPEREDGGYLEGNPSQHRTLAISSMAVMAASGIMMLIWK
ncbi:MAG: hypothetical protein OEW44_07340 [Gemmatimonadota bacterium]|jgi:hypothetical protein|nr:hypothetical protein [Gemmatimonadota bacterium]